MARAVTRYERTGLDTGTGDRSAARMAGSGPSAGTIVTPVSEGRKTVTDLFKDMVDKQTEAERVNTAAQKARNAYMSGEPVPLNSAGSQTIADVNTEKILTNTASTLKVANQGYAEREGINAATQNDRGNLSPGASSGFGSSASSVTGPKGITTVTGGGFLSQWAADDKARETSLAAQKAANATQSQIDANRAVGLDNSFTQRYAASVAADAQRDSATKSMFAALAGGSGGYKYWGG